MQIDQIHKQLIVSELRTRIGSGKGKETQSEIAMALKIQQSTISRILQGRFVYANKSVGLLCKHFGIDPFCKTPDIDPNKSSDLIDALKYAWDGSEEHAKSLAHLIRAAGAIQTRRIA